MSGIGGQGGTDAFKTHFVGSGSGHAGHGGQTGRSAPPGGQDDGGHAHGRGLMQRSQTVFPDTSINASVRRLPTVNPI